MLENENSDTVFLSYYVWFPETTFKYGGADWNLKIRDTLSDIELVNVTASEDCKYIWKSPVRISAFNHETSSREDFLDLDNVEFSKNRHTLRFTGKSRNISQFVRQQQYQIFISFKNRSIDVQDQAMAHLAKLNTSLLLSALEKGNVSIICKNDKVVKADYIFLSQNPFFQSLVQFKENQVADNDPKTADLSQFDKATVIAWVQFLYTGKFDAPESLESRLHLYKLADYTLEKSLKDAVVNLILKEGYD